jgi:Abortive infection alpha
MPPRSKKGSGVTVTIPSKPVGRLIDALADSIRPFTEARGLKADQIRLQREEVAIEIAKRAKERLAIEKTPIKPIPNKILVPLLEAASNEDIDDTYMVDMWAMLLASGAKDTNVEPRYIGILKELRKKQAKVLHALATNKREAVDDFAASLLDAPGASDPDIILRHLDDLLDNAYGEIGAGKQPDMARIQDILSSMLNHPGCCIGLLRQYYEDIEVTAPESLFSTVKCAIDLEILASLGLCRRVSEYRCGPNMYDIYLEYHYITFMGLDFLSYCCPDLLKENPSRTDPPRHSAPPHHAEKDPSSGGSLKGL